MASMGKSIQRTGEFCFIREYEPEADKSVTGEFSLPLPLRPTLQCEQLFAHHEPVTPGQ